VEEQIVLVLIQIVEAYGTLEPKLDSRKSDGVDGANIIVASRWLGLQLFLIIITLLLGCLLPQERDKSCHQGFAIPEILTSLFFQFFNPLF
jgi:hypothetical protein